MRLFFLKPTVFLWSHWLAILGFLPPTTPLPPRVGRHFDSPLGLIGMFFPSHGRFPLIRTPEVCSAFLRTFFLPHSCSRLRFLKFGDFPFHPANPLFYVCALDFSFLVRPLIVQAYWPPPHFPWLSSLLEPKRFCFTPLASVRLFSTFPLSF